jgi:predicted MFS family arabinose efflux permease
VPAATATDQQPGLAHPIGKDSDASRQAALLALRCAAGLAAAMGLGRFVFTAVLPMMQDSAGVSAGSGSLLATANYLGYLVGALAAMALSASVERRIVWQVSSMALVASLVLMGVTEHLWLWVVLRAVAGVASALLFIVVVRVIVRATWSHHHSGWAYGGVGAGIVLASLIASVCDLIGGWRAVWVLTGLIVAMLLAVGSPSRADAPSPAEAAKQDLPADTGDLAARRSEPPHHEGGHRTHARLFSVLVACYFLEGAGYIIAGTFLVATAHANNAAWVAHSLWLIVGLAAVPSCVLWSWLSRHVSRPMLLMIALALQAAGIALTGASTGTASAIATGLLFGGTFMGATTLALAAGNELAIPASVAILSAAYAIGQAAGPSVVTPLTTHGYQAALLGAAGIVALAAALAALLRLRFPPHLLRPAPAGAAHAN